MRNEAAPTDISPYHILCLKLLDTFQIKIFDDSNSKVLLVTINEQLYSL